MSVLVVGSVALDSIQTPAGSVEDEPGGSALYASVAANFFSSVHVVATVGSDFPRDVCPKLEEHGIDTTGITIEEGETFRWSGIYEEDPNKRRTLLTNLGVFERFKPVLPDNFRKASFLFLANIDPDLQREVLRQVESPRLTLCDTMNFWISGKRESLTELLGEIDILLINDEEAREFSGEISILKSGRWLLERGPRYVVIKKGEHGALLFGRSEFFSVPSYPIYDVVDPTGAGDTFAGAMIGYLAGCPDPGFGDMKKSLINGSVLASYCIEGFGARRLLSLTEQEIASRRNTFLDMLTS